MGEGNRCRWERESEKEREGRGNEMEKRTAEKVRKNGKERECHRRKNGTVEERKWMDCKARVKRKK